jgi:hypothetical protein
MLSHYAEKHTSICLEFGIDYPLMRLALEVVYPENYPVWLPHEIGEESAIKMLLTKAKAWDYESEFRIISMYDNAKQTAGALYVENGCFTT